jgi:EAL and modified HD-GYP domain-containing signal transduction protein
MNHIYIGRQPIYDCDLRLFAYELLYRANSEQNAAGDIDHDLATAQVVLNAFLEFGLNRLVGDKLAFINLPRSFIDGDFPLPFPKEHVVLEILEDIKVDDRLINSVRRLRTIGCKFTLDDFIYHPALKPLIENCEIIKIDFQALSHDEIKNHVAELRQYNVKLLAEKVETHEDFAFARDLGFSYFQGYFFCRPSIVSGQSIPPNKLTAMRILSALQDPDIRIGTLANLVSQDVNISFKLLRSLNSAYYALPKRIESIHHAVVLMGIEQIKQWVTLIVLASIPDKPIQLMIVAMTRAKMCEQLDESSDKNSKNKLFTVGLFSVLDALLDKKMDKIMEDLPLANDIKGALIRHEGSMGSILKSVISYEQGLWDDIDIPQSTASELSNKYLTAVSWADEIAKTF